MEHPQQHQLCGVQEPSRSPQGEVSWAQEQEPSKDDLGPKILVEKAFPSGIAMAPTKMVWVPKLKAWATKEEVGPEDKASWRFKWISLSLLVSGNPPTYLDINLIDVKCTLML